MKGARCIRRESGLTTRFEAAVVIALFFCAFPKSAHAYLDPGAGSMFLQGLFAAFFAVVAYLGIFRRRIKSWWRRFVSKEKQ